MAGEYTTDFLIIGGGITGVSLAALLAERGQPVMLAEAGKIGEGTTGRSTGNLYELIDSSLFELTGKYNIDKVKNIILGRRTAIALMKDMIDRYGIQAGQTTCNMYQFSMDDKNVKSIRDELDVASKIGSPFMPASPDEIPLPSFNAIKTGQQLQVNPLRYVTELCQKLDPELVDIYEDSAVTHVERLKEDFIVSTADARIRARNIIYATHTPKGVMFEQTLLGPYREYGIACRLSHRLNFNGIYWGYLKKEKLSVRFYEIKGVPYVLVIGKRHKTGEVTDNERLIKELKEFAYQYFPIQSVIYAWGGQHYRPADLLPYIGEVAPHEYIGTGYATDGLVYGTLAASIIRDLLLEEDNGFAALFSPARFNPVKSARNFVKENMDVAGKIMSRILDIGNYHDRDFSQIASETGAVVDHGGHKLAVYRAPDKKLIVKSAICPHMGCVVQFNKAEQSWDCPCHGSRFAVTGEVLEGPSLKPLASITGNKGKVKIVEDKK